MFSNSQSQHPKILGSRTKESQTPPVATSRRRRTRRQSSRTVPEGSEGATEVSQATQAPAQGDDSIRVPINNHRIFFFYVAGAGNLHISCRKVGKMGPSSECRRHLVRPAPSAQKFRFRHWLLTSSLLALSHIKPPLGTSSLLALSH